jgi:hypothetical protein
MFINIHKQGYRENFILIFCIWDKTSYTVVDFQMQVQIYNLFSGFTALFCLSFWSFQLFKTNF